jgi:hypothetical protein
VGSKGEIKEKGREEGYVVLESSSTGNIKKRVREISHRLVKIVA